MMRLRKLSVGTWSVLALVEADGNCALDDEIRALYSAKQTKATAVGLFALWRQIPAEGPRKLGTDLYHQLDSANEIYEFLKGNHRVLCFQTGGRVVLCSHLIRKKRNTVPAREIAKAVRLRNEYLVAMGANEVVIEE